jgi:uncharacterized protein (DUF2267 family)
VVEKAYITANRRGCKTTNFDQIKTKPMEPSRVPTMRAIILANCLMRARRVLPGDSKVLEEFIERVRAHAEAHNVSMEQIEEIDVMKVLKYHRLNGKVLKEMVRMSEKAGIWDVLETDTMKVLDIMDD